MGYGERENYLERKDAQKDYVLFSGRLCVVICKPNHAVSYTHLRAHETVLDLVCRLLLEKKKKKYRKKIKKKNKKIKISIG